MCQFQPVKPQQSPGNPTEAIQRGRHSQNRHTTGTLQGLAEGQWTQSVSLRIRSSLALEVLTANSPLLPQVLQSFKQVAPMMLITSKEHAYRHRQLAWQRRKNASFCPSFPPPSKDAFSTPVIPSDQHHNSTGPLGQELSQVTPGSRWALLTVDPSQQNHDMIQIQLRSCCCFLKKLQITQC